MNYTFDPSGYFGVVSSGTGFWTFTVLCANPIDCNAAGYPGQDIVINQHYNNNNPYIDYYSVNGADPIGVYIGCVNEPDYGTSCGYQLANLGPAKAGLNCEGSAKSIGGWFNGTDTHDNEISQIYEVQFLGPGVQAIIGWVYQTFNAGNFFQPNAQVTGTGGSAVVQIGVSTSSPAVPIGSITGANISAAVNAWFTAVGIVPTTTNAPAFLMKAMARGSKIGSAACFSPAWDGKATAGKRRRT